MGEGDEVSSFQVKSNLENHLWRHAGQPAGSVVDFVDLRPVVAVVAADAATVDVVVASVVDLLKFDVVGAT
jgi:hypothetical protein